MPDILQEAIALYNRICEFGDTGRREPLSPTDMADWPRYRPVQVGSVTLQCLEEAGHRE